MKLHRNYSLVLLLVCNRSGVLSHALRWEKPMPWLILKRQVGSALGSRSTGALLPSPEQPGWQCVTFLCIHTHREVRSSVPHRGAPTLLFWAKNCKLPTSYPCSQEPESAGKGLTENKKSLPSYIHGTAQNKDENRNTNIQFQQVNLTKDIQGLNIFFFRSIDSNESYHSTTDFCLSLIFFFFFWYELDDEVTRPLTTVIWARIQSFTGTYFIKTSRENKELQLRNNIKLPCYMEGVH